MVYSEFTLSKVLSQFGLNYDDTIDLFSLVPEATISLVLETNLQRGVRLALRVNSEKARSEFIIAPILLELNDSGANKISLFSGSSFNVNAKEGLVGICDFIISDSPIQSLITAPVLMVVEAKNENIAAGLGQCGASMVAAQQFNQQANNAMPVIYGAVTTGDMWQFLKLENTRLQADKNIHYLSNITKIMGILVDITGLNLSAVV